MRIAIVGLIGAGAIVVGCGTGAAQTVRTATGQRASGESARLQVPQGDWPTFDYNAQRTGVGPAKTGITVKRLGALRRSSVTTTGGVVDSSPILLHRVSVGGKLRTVFIVTTDYGRTIAYNANTGKRLWQYTPRSLHRLLGSAQITTATPVAGPRRRFVYATSPDGFVQKLRVANGHRVWRRRVTFDPTREKLAGALNIDGSQLVVVTDGYYGDAPTYQGHVVTLTLGSGHITHVWNSLCSGVHHLLRPPSRCPASGSAIWGRPGSVVEPGTGKLLVATGNGDFNGRTRWGDSVLELSPKLRLLHNYTPRNQRQLNTSDQDLGSTEPALLPVSGGRHFAVQGGKDGLLRLLNLKRLDGTTGGAGRRKGGELQTISAPGRTDVFGQPVVWSTGNGRAYVFVADGAGTAAYRYGSNHRLRLVWQDSIAANNPVMAGGLLYVYAIHDHRLEILNPRTGKVHRSLSAGSQDGHWNSPIVIGGRIILPTGDSNQHLTRGRIYIYHLPGY